MSFGTVFDYLIVATLISLFICILLIFVMGDWSEKFLDKQNLGIALAVIMALNQMFWFFKIFKQNPH